MVRNAGASWGTSWWAVGALALLLLGGAAVVAWQRMSAAPAPLAVTRAPDGSSYAVLNRGPYKIDAFYDRAGRLQRTEYDSNGDGRPDHFSYYEGALLPRRIDVDEDYDGTPDRREEYDGGSQLARVGRLRRPGAVESWIYPAGAGRIARREFDSDVDGRVDRAESLDPDGRLAEVTVDADRNGRVDRWQHVREGRLLEEDLDTDGDGRPDRRIRYGPGGEVVALVPIGGDRPAVR